MTTVRDIVFLNNRDNTIDYILKSDAVAQDLSGVTRMLLKDVDGSWEIDSNDYASAFDWVTGTTGKVTITPASALEAKGVAAGIYEVKLLIYDATNVHGVVWPNLDTWTLTVRDI